MSKQHSVLVVDNGTGYTKLGFAGSLEPTYIIPTAYCEETKNKTIQSRNKLDDLNYWIGDEAHARSNTHIVTNPVRHACIADWTQMERMWSGCFYKYLHVDPTEHGVLLTEAPMNPPENREQTAEIMFETFGVRSMAIQMQAVLAMFASTYISNKNQADEAETVAKATGRKASDVLNEMKLEQQKKYGKTNTYENGVVVDIGDGVSHIIPVYQGFVINNAVKSIPIGGKNLTQFILDDFLRTREKDSLPKEAMINVTRYIKENYCYVAEQGLQAEFAKWDASPDKIIKKYRGTHPITHKPFSCEIGYERFLAPEIFFNPQIYSCDYSLSTPELVDQVIQNCPIDTRRSLYSNIVLSGGSTMVKGFGPRLEREITEITTERLAKNAKKIAASLNQQVQNVMGKAIQVHVSSHNFQRYAVWLGGSILASTESQWEAISYTREEYAEYGNNIFRECKKQKDNVRL